MDVHKVWRVFLLQVAFAREYPVAYQLSSLGIAVRNPVLESILPSLLYIKMTAILDDALDEHLDSLGMVLPKGYRQDLNGRICFCSDSGFIDNGLELHVIRRARNDMAHEPFAAGSWDELDRDMTHVHHTLQHLGFVGDRPEFRVMAERSAFRESDEPGILGHRDYTVRVMQGDERAAEFTWGETLHDDTAS